MVSFLIALLFGWLVADIGRGSMSPLTPIVVAFLLVCVAFALANKYSEEIKADQEK